jgi:hypothetical protein
VEKWRYSSAILDFGTRWRRIVSFTPRPLCPRGKGPLYSLDRRLDGPQSRSGRRGGDKNSWPHPDLNSDPSARPAASRCTDWAIPAPSRLPVQYVFTDYDGWSTFSSVTRHLQIQSVYPAVCMADPERAVTQVSFCLVSGQCRQKRKMKRRWIG